MSPTTSSRTEFIPAPADFFSRFLPQIDSLAELKVTLHVYRILYHRRGYPRFVTFTELLSETDLIAGLGGEVPAETLKEALALAARRGSLQHLNLMKDRLPEDIYLLNTAADARALASIKEGMLDSKGFTPSPEPLADFGQRPNIYSLYEQNIGLLTPLIAGELKEAEKLYPADWIQEAFKEAVDLNKRNWRYISRILERWSTEGKYGKSEGHSKKKTDPDKYIKGKYGAFVRR